MRRYETAIVTCFEHSIYANLYPTPRTGDIEHVCPVEVRAQQLLRGPEYIEYNPAGIDDVLQRAEIAKPRRNYPQLQYFGDELKKRRIIEYRNATLSS